MKLVKIGVWERSIQQLKSWYEVVLESRLRYIIPIFVVFVLKIVGAFWLYRGLQHPISMYHVKNSYRYLDATQWDFFNVFLNWDSIFFMENAGGWGIGYLPEFSGQYAFLPGYPTIISLLNFVLRDIGASAVLPAFIFGVAWVYFFQSVAENYISKRESMNCALIAALFPITFLFTTVAYSESLFLFACVASWYYHLKDKPLYASLLASLASVTRIYGIFIVLPLLLDFLLKKKWKKIPYLSLPFLSLFFWSFFCYVKTGDWLASIHAEVFWTTSKNSWFNARIIPLLSGEHIELPYTFAWEISFVTIIGVLAFLTFKTDWRLALYSIAMFGGIIVAAGSLHSYVRYLFFIFPIWLKFKTKNFVITAAICTICYIHSLMIWYQFHVGWVA